jgi:Domain of unknown function (DUF4349)
MSRSFRAFGARARHGAVRTLLIAGAASAATGLALAACSAAGRTASNGSGSGGGGGVPGAAAPAERHAAAQQAAAGKSAAGATYRGARLAVSAQSIIYTANLSVRVKGGVTAAANQATGIATDAGGYVAGEQEIIPPGSHGVPQFDLTLKIPVAQYGVALAKLKELGTKISFSQHAQDVTQQVADVGSRVASAQAAIRQLRALLSKAGSVSQLLAVQEEINGQESDLEALLAQQRSLARETSYATVTAVIIGHHARLVAKPKKASPGFLAGLKGGWHALGVVVGWLLTALGSALPFLIPLALIAAIAIEGRRRLARRKTPPASEPPAPAAS